jgi:hypothetical protein
VYYCGFALLRSLGKPGNSVILGSLCMLGQPSAVAAGMHSSTRCLGVLDKVVNPGEIMMPTAA